jgi:hypothetical protein
MPRKSSEFAQWEEAKKTLDAAEAKLRGWDKTKVVTQTLKAWSNKERSEAFEQLVDEWISDFPAGKAEKTRKRLDWLSEHWGKPFVRKDKATGKETNAIRGKSLRSVLQELLLFALSGAESVGASKPVEFGVLEGRPENEKVISALTSLAEGSTEVVGISRRDYNHFQMVMRMLREQGQEFKLPNGGTIRAKLDELLPEGLEGLMTEKEMIEHENRKAGAAKALITKAGKNAPVAVTAEPE